MKRNLLFMSMLASLFMVGCSNEDVISENGNGDASDPQYLTINLVTNSSNDTRVTGDPNNATYEEGLTPENDVKEVRFYFFDANNAPAKVRKVGDTYYNYLDWTSISNEGQNMPNVEKILSATLIIQSPKGDSAPDKIVAIINPTEEMANDNLSLTNLADVAGDYKIKTQSGEFVMSNSTYEDNATTQMAVSVQDKICKTAAEALSNPVDIYVERTVAKVRLNSSLQPIEGSSDIFKTSTNDKEQKFGEEEIFVKFLGWNTTAVTDKSRLVKKINPTWADNLLSANEPWNWAPYHRSFWAINASNVDYQYGAFVSGDDKDNLFQAQAKTKFDKTEWVYINENASADVEDTNLGDEPTTPTKVIIAAQLVDSKGNPLEFAEYGSTRTTIEGLKALFANNCGLYKKDESGTEIIFSKITDKELEIKTATAVGEANKDKEGRYKVYIQLTKDAENIIWYPTNNKDAVALTTAQANDALKNLGAAKVWKDGNTYYYFDIKHLADKIGVVRNHIYDANITGLTGLGTPVYDPDEIIYPEKPKDDEDTFIAARINILSWRVVSNDVTLDW